jgi:hypothetical protein
MASYAAGTSYPRTSSPRRPGISLTTLRRLERQPSVPNNRGPGPRGGAGRPGAGRPGAPAGDRDHGQ